MRSEPDGGAGAESEAEGIRARAGEVEELFVEAAGFVDLIGFSGGGAADGEQVRVNEEVEQESLVGAEQRPALADEGGGLFGVAAGKKDLGEEFAGEGGFGGRFRDGTVFIPEVLLSARAMNTALAVLEPYLAEEKKQAAGKVLIGTVRGDLHDIGKNIVATMLRGVGFEVVDLGINIPVEDFAAGIERHAPNILGMSALLTTTMPEMKKVIDLLVARGIRDRVKVMVGGAPVNEKFARDIGADGYAADAGSAVDLAKRLVRR